MCKETNGGYKFFSDNFEDQFKEVRCVPPVGLTDCPHHKQKHTPTLVRTAYNVLSGLSGTVQDFFFASFVTCSDIKASLHRAFKVCEPRKSTHTLQPDFIPSFLPSRIGILTNT